MSNTYKAIYKCRLCGKLYDSGFRTGESVAVKTTHLMIAGLEYQPKHWGNELPRERVHYCDNDAMGISDFVGWQKEEEKEEEKEFNPYEIPF